MSQSKIIAGLTALVVLYSGLSFFLLGRQSGDTPAKRTAVEASAAVVDKPVNENAAQQSVPETVSENREQPPQLAPEAPSIAVEIGVDGPTLDACTSSGRPKGLNPDGDNFLAVKAAPNLQARRIDKLGPGAEFYICRTAQGGDWTGIVHGAGGGLAANCAVSSPVDRRQDYSGSCRSGWVFSKYVELVAG